MTTMMMRLMMAKMMMMMIMFGSFVDVANVGNNIGNGSAGVNHPPSSCSSSSSPSSLVSLAPSSSLSLHRSHHYSTGLVSCEVDSTSTNMHVLLPAAASWIPKLHPCALYPNTLCLVSLIILGLGRVNLVQKPGANHTLLVVAT